MRKLSKGTGNEMAQLAYMMKAGVTVFEFTRSKIVQTLSSYLFNVNKNQEKRIMTFLDTFKSEQAFPDFIKILEKTIKTDKIFKVGDRYAGRAMMQKVMLRLTYDPLRSEVGHEFFENEGRVDVPVDALQSFSVVLRHLWQISSQNELYAFIGGLDIRELSINYLTSNRSS